MPTEPFIGQIMPAGFGITPKGWLPCNGQILPIQQNSALFSLLGVTYGGDGVRTFALPDLRGRAILGSNIGSVAWGQIGGTENVILLPQHLPAHNHSIEATTKIGTGRSASPTNNIFAATNTTEMIFAPAGNNEVPLAPSTNVGSAGNGGQHNNMQPYLAINYLIAISGIFPSRP
ncbi:MAG: tail fiber protein [Methylobacterium sp.]|uniref:phage tail protein n=1 Tax=Methylobacterium sp. TaxID=409 RepID=UPI0027263EC0|nr:tail fiber protein [Methylobacterium sp.]MDO9426065.1 tail fiber protein [Methylobacterium sp.]